MISAWQVYLVLQLDSFIGTFLVLSIVLGIAALVLGVAFLFANADGVEDVGMLKLALKRIVWGFFLSLAMVTTLPSSKTMAAMIILPAITSHEVVDPVAKEAGELYKLAKDALKKAVNDDEPTTTTEKTDNAQG